MKKITFLLIAISVALISFAQTTRHQSLTPTFKLSQNKTSVSPSRAITGTLTHSTGEMETNGLGTGFGGKYVAASKFTANELTNYVGQYITRISVGISDISGIMTAKVAIVTWTEDSHEITLEQNFTAVKGINTILLSTPYQIPATTDIMIAYEVNITGGSPLGVDGGPFVEGVNYIGAYGLENTLRPLEESVDGDVNFNFVISATVENEISTEPILLASPGSLSFGGTVGENATDAKIIIIEAANLTENITASTNLPFEVSNDNSTFGTTATLETAGTLYVRYNPANAETLDITGTVTISSEGAESQIINLTANTYDCDIARTELPYSEDFADGMPYCWTVEDVNNDGNTWVAEENYAGSVATYVYSEQYAGNDYLFTKKIQLSAGNYIVKFNYMAGEYGYTEKLKVFYGTEATPEAMTTEIVNLPNISNVDEWQTSLSNISIAEDGVYYIGFKAYSDANMFLLFVDNFTIDVAPTNPGITLTSITPAEGTDILINTPFNIRSTIFNNGITLNSYTITYTIDDNEPITRNIENLNLLTGETHTYTLENISFETAGSKNITVTVSNPNGIADDDDTNNSITTIVDAISCEPVTTFPYTENFEDDIPYCWTTVDANSDGLSWHHVMSPSFPGHNNSQGCMASASYTTANINGQIEAVGITPDNWLITHAITLPENSPASLTFFAAAQDEDYAAEHYGVFVSTTTNDISEFTLVFEETMDANGGTRQSAWGEKHVNLSDYAGETIYIAFRHFNCSDNFYILIDDFTIALEEHNTTSVDENISSAIAVYPNPSNNFVTIANAEGLNISIVNSLGQIVANIENASANQIIDVSNFANGTYFVKVNAEVLKLNIIK